MLKYLSASSYRLFSLITLIILIIADNANFTASTAFTTFQGLLWGTWILSIFVISDKYFGAASKARTSIFIFIIAVRTSINYFSSCLLYTSRCV